MPALTLAAAACFLAAAIGYALATESGSPLAGWLLGAVVISGAGTLLLLARWSIRRRSHWSRSRSQ